MASGEQAAQCGGRGHDPGEHAAHEVCQVDLPPNVWKGKGRGKGRGKEKGKGKEKEKGKEERKKRRSVSTDDPLANPSNENNMDSFQRLTQQIPTELPRLCHRPCGEEHSEQHHGHHRHRTLQLEQLRRCARWRQHYPDKRAGTAFRLARLMKRCAW